MASMCTKIWQKNHCWPIWPQQKPPSSKIAKGLKTSTGANRSWLDSVWFGGFWFGLVGMVWFGVFCFSLFWFWFGQFLMIGLDRERFGLAHLGLPFAAQLKIIFDLWISTRWKLEVHSLFPFSVFMFKMVSGFQSNGQNKYLRYFHNKKNNSR